MGEEWRIMLYIVSLVFGLSVGSFLNVVILRFSEIKSILTTRSHCPNCKRIIPWYDLIPFLSFVILGGRCRNCARPISWQYPIVEVVTGCLTLLVVYWFDLTWASAFLLALIYVLIVISVYDIKTMTIPDGLILLGMIFSIGYVLISKEFVIGDTADHLLGFVIGLGAPAFIVLITLGKGMGVADIKLGGILGLILGYPSVAPALFLSVIIGAFVGIYLLLNHKKSMKDPVPFGPFLVIGFLIALFYGVQIWQWYVNIY